MAAKKTYRVDYERDASGDWTAVIDRSQGVSCVTQARTISQARKRIRDALALYLNNEKAAQSAELVENFVLPPGARAAVFEFADARARARQAAERSASASATAAKKLAAVGVSLRDASQILGVSHQRVHQFAVFDVGPRKKAAKKSAKRGVKMPAKAFGARKKRVAG